MMEQPSKKPRTTPSSSVGPVHNGVLLQYMYMPQGYKPGTPSSFESPLTGTTTVRSGNAALPDSDREMSATASSSAHGDKDEDGDEEVQCTGEISRAERDAQLRAAAVVIDDTPVRPVAAPALHPTTPGGDLGATESVMAEQEDEVEVTGELTWAERDAQLRANAIEIDDAPTPAGAAEPRDEGFEPKPKVESPSALDAAGSDAGPSGAVVDDPLLAARIRMEQPTPGYQPPSSGGPRNESSNE